MATDIWEVVGGADKGGIVVRAAKETSSDLLPSRLSTGAFVRGLAMEGERLKYDLLTGTGPPSGWVSIRIGDKSLLVRSDSVWEVVGGGEKGGILVRAGRETSSDPCLERLSKGALVAEVQLDGERMSYQLLAGSGPPSGWVSTRTSDKQLLVKARQPSDSPPSPPPHHVAPPQPRKMRVLAMCGSITCKEILKFQTGPLVNVVGKGAAEWTYVEGDYQHPWELAASLSEFERQVASKRGQLTAWYGDIYHCDKDRPTIEKQFDPEVRVESVDIPERVAKLERYIHDAGPFDVVLAFSQGCIMVHLLIGHLRRKSEVMPWKLSVFFEGMHIRDKQYFDLFATKSPHPTVHVFGKSSPFYQYAREGWCADRRVEDYYADPVVLTHEEGHQFPMQQPRASEIYQAVSEEMRKRSGAMAG